MFVSYDQVQQRIGELYAEADAARLARQAHSDHPGHNGARELLGSIVTSARAALTPVLPRLDEPAYRH